MQDILDLQKLDAADSALNAEADSCTSSWILCCNEEEEVA